MKGVAMPLRLGVLVLSLAAMQEAAGSNNKMPETHLERCRACSRGNDPGDDLQSCPRRTPEDPLPCNGRRGVGESHDCGRQHFSFFQGNIARRTLGLHTENADEAPAAPTRPSVGGHPPVDAAVHGTVETPATLDAVHQLLRRGTRTVQWLLSRARAGLDWHAGANAKGNATSLILTSRHWASHATANVMEDHFLEMLFAVVVFMILLLGVLSCDSRRGPDSAFQPVRGNHVFSAFSDERRQSMVGTSTRSAPVPFIPGPRASLIASMGGRSLAPTPLSTSHALTLSTPAMSFVDCPPHRSTEPLNKAPVEAAVSPRHQLQGHSKRFSPLLCPGLVVPRGSECILAVRISQTTGSAPTTVEVLDLCGKPVLKAQVARPLQWSQANCQMIKMPSWIARPPAVTLCMLQAMPGSGLLESIHGRPDSSVLATGRECVMPDGHRHMFFHDANEKLFGRLVKDRTRSRYVFNTIHTDPMEDQADGKKGTVTFDGIFSDHVVLVSNEHQEPLADAEPSPMPFCPQSKFYKLRVASGVDVGLVICGMFAIDVMETA